MRPRARVTGRRRMCTVCALRAGERASDIRVAKLLGFHLAARPDWTNRHCQRVGSSSSTSIPIPRTRHAHSRGLMGIIRRYYLREGSHARIPVALPGRVPYFNPQLRRVCQPSFHPFVPRSTKPPRDSVKTGDHLVLDSALSEGHQRCRNANVTKVIVKIDVIKIV